MYFADVDISVVCQKADSLSELHLFFSFAIVSSTSAQFACSHCLRMNSLLIKINVMAVTVWNG